MNNFPGKYKWPKLIYLSILVYSDTEHIFTIVTHQLSPKLLSRWFPELMLENQQFCGALKKKFLAKKMESFIICSEIAVQSFFYIILFLRNTRWGLNSQPGIKNHMVHQLSQVPQPHNLYSKLMRIILGVVVGRELNVGKLHTYLTNEYRRKADIKY